jgi:murein DD-endopeptidase MepM/ murein hydrolase activator NlpD
VQLIVERSDGSRIARLPAPRWLVSVAVGVAGLSLVALAAVYTDYRLLARHRAEFAALEARTTEQQRLLETLQGRLARIREDIDGWRELHARIWTPFGPDGGPALRTGGVGGPTATLPEPPAVPAASLLEEVERLASVVAEEGESLRALERFIGKAGRVISSLPSRWPVRGPVNSDFGRRVSPWAGGGSEHHSGLDIGAPRGTEVRAPAPGTVVFAGAHAEYGIALIIDHGNDIKTLYGHLQKALVEPGQAVQRGQRIALTGNTGRSSGPHLHYEIQVSGRPVNPRSYLWD